MSLRRDLVANASMRSLLIVELDKLSNTLLCILDALEAMFSVDDLRLQNTIHTFCYGIVRRLIVLSHADSDLVLPE